MFVAKVCSEQIEEVYQEFVNAGFKAEIKPNFIIEIYEAVENESRIRNVIYDKNLPVFIDIF